MKRDPSDISFALSQVLTSPNESDRNGEVANVVDGLFAIARALDRVADAIRGAPDRGLSTYKGPGDP